MFVNQAILSILISGERYLLESSFLEYIIVYTTGPNKVEHSVANSL